MFGRKAEALLLRLPPRYLRDNSCAYVVLNPSCHERPPKQTPTSNSSSVAQDSVRFQNRQQATCMSPLQPDILGAFDPATVTRTTFSTHSRILSRRYSLPCRPERNPTCSVTPSHALISSLAAHSRSPNYPLRCSEISSNTYLLPETTK